MSASAGVNFNSVLVAGGVQLVGVLDEVLADEAGMQIILMGSLDFLSLDFSVLHTFSAFASQLLQADLSLAACLATYFMASALPAFFAKTIALTFAASLSFVYLSLIAFVSMGFDLGLLSAALGHFGHL